MPTSIRTIKSKRFVQRMLRLYAHHLVLVALVLTSFIVSESSPTDPPIANSTSLEVARRSCAKHPLAPELWKELELDEYMKDYSGGKTLTLQAYADKVNVTNFICGIGQFCNAGQLCSSAMAPDWYILVATQNWNQLINMIYTSLQFGIGAVQDIAPSMITDLCPPRSSLPVESATWLGLAAAFSGALPGMIFPGMYVWVWVFIQGVLYTTASEIWFYQNVIRAPPDVMSGYTKWTNFAWMLSVLQDKAQEKVHNYTKGVMKSGISTENGMYGVLKNGVFLQRSLERTQFSLQASFEAIIKLKLLTAIMRAQNYYITRGSDPCHHDGVNGAFSGKDVLSYCGEDHVMMNVVKAKGSKTHKKVFGASLIQSKYGFSTAFLTKSAWNCQVKYGKYEYDPYQNSTLPTDVNADCLFNLPVCDCTQEDVARKRRKGVRTAEACIEAGVPIRPTEKNKSFS